MNPEIFHFYYPIPDDIAQSILISETENNIHLRPLHDHAKKLWLYNKLIKNLLMGRKTILVVNTSSDYDIIEEFLQSHKLHQLAFIFTHSRSNNEKRLGEFSPIIVNGSLKTKKFIEAVQKVSDTHFNLALHYDFVFNRRSNAHFTYSKLIARSIHYRNQLGQYAFLIPEINALSQKDFLRLKKILPDAISLSKGNHSFLENFQIIKPEVFNLFSKEEAWLSCLHEIKRLETQFKVLYQKIQSYQNSFIENHFNQKYKNLYELFIPLESLYQSVDPTQEQSIRISVIESQLAKELMTIDSHFRPEQLKLYRDSEQLRILSYKYAVTQWEQHFEQELIDTLHNGIKYEINSLLSTCKILNLIDENSNAILSIKKAKNIITKLLRKFDSIKRLEEYFGIYFEWQVFLNNLPASHRNYFISLNSIPVIHWENLLELAHIEKQIESFGTFHLSQVKLSEVDFYSAIDEYKSEMLPFIQYKYESVQHKSVSNLQSSHTSLYDLIHLHKQSDLTLTDFYQSLPLLSDIFPILVLDNVKPDNIPNFNGRIWDEVIFMDSNLDNIQSEKLKNSCHHVIHLHEASSSESIFNIAMIQAPPVKLNNILLDLHPSDPFTPIQNLSQFIFANKSKFTVFINSKEFILSFLPEEWNQLFSNSLLKDYNMFDLSEDSGIEKLNNWLHFKPTVKKLFVLNHLLVTEGMTIQQMGWHKQFIRCLHYAGFQIEYFDLKVLCESRTEWPYYFSNSLFASPIIKEPLSEINI